MNALRETRIVLPLDGGALALEVAGGKGAALSSMATGGLPVPPGFIVTTEAYRAFVAANGLQAAIDGATGGLPDSGPAAWEQASTAIQARFAQADLPPEAADAIRAAYRALGSPAVAVRSSATAEDLPGASFAGQQESFLNVRGEAALLDAVRRCWASLWTARALQYRRRLGIEPEAVTMGVVVQALVPADVSGVLFTANPTTGARSEILVNASFGLGEAIVSGQVTPDSYAVDRATLAPTSVTVGAKQVMTVASEDDGQGTSAVPVPEDRRAGRALSAALLHHLATLALRVEEHFGGVPQDVEWAVADGRCWLLQSRPITGLPPAPLQDVRWEPPIPGSKWIRRQVVEHMPDPLSSLFEELYLLGGLEQAIGSIMSVLDLPNVVDELMDRPVFAAINGYAYMRADIKLRPLLLARYLVTGLPTLFRAGIPNWRDRALPAYLLAVQRWKDRDPAALSDGQLLDRIRDLAGADARYWWAAALAIGVAKVTDSLLDGFLAKAAPGRKLSSGRFLSGLSATALASETELDALADPIRASETLRRLVAEAPAATLPAILADHPEGREVRAGLAAYLDRHGHQIYSLDFAEPTLIDDPLPVLLSLKALAEQPSGAVQVRRARLAREQRALMVATLRSFDPLRRAIFRRVLGWARRFAPYREEALFYVGFAWPTVRRLALELGRRLAEAGSLDRPDDVFFLHSAEILAASDARAAGRGRADLARLAHERRELREARMRLHPPAAVPPAYRFRMGPIDLSSRESQRRNADAATTLSGFAVSPGRVTAPASVIHSPADFDRMVPGTILVCPTTTPAWTPLFAQARGLVTDIGGILAHGSIVAREYGIPAVMGTGNATQRIGSGQMIAVDGDAGTVTLER